MRMPGGPLGCEWTSTNEWTLHGYLYQETELEKQIEAASKGVLTFPLNYFETMFLASVQFISVKQDSFGKTGHDIVCLTQSSWEELVK